MAEPVQRLLGDERVIGGGEVHVFGIRHLSPGGAYHLLAFLEEKKPTAVLIEGPDDAGVFIAQLTSRGVIPPVAILAYTDELPVRTLLYPYADYSPEYQAFQWAHRLGAHAEFIDLPSDVALALYEQRRHVKADDGGSGDGKPGAAADAERRPDEATPRELVKEEEPTGAADSQEAGGAGDEAAWEDQTDKRRNYYRSRHELYEQVAHLAGEPDYEAYWERSFEHSLEKEAYRQAVGEFSVRWREMTEAEEWRHVPGEAAYNEIREAYMRRKIQEQIAAGHAPDRIVVVTGAHHASAIDFRLPAMTDTELACLPRRKTKLTLMPYSYYKLSSHSGYGAGNQAPAYYELFWQCLQQEELHKLPSLYLSHVASRLREHGTHRSTASVIEAVRLAEALASLHGGSRPTWRDLRDAATVCLGYGELPVIAEALARVDIGTAIGSLPEGVSQTPIQDDLNRELKRLKLDKYKTAVAASLELDLRENRRVKSEEAAYLDLNRSILLHRLEVLGISFAKAQHIGQKDASWAEHWVLQWTPEAEIEAVESTLKGETLELAVAYVLHERLQQCSDIAEASRLIRIACDCGLPQVMEQARASLQELAVDAGNLDQIAAAAHELSVLLNYGSLRKMDTGSLIPLLQQLFLRGALLLNDAAACNDDAAKSLIGTMNVLNLIAQEHYDFVNEALWLNKLEELATRDDRNAKLSGFAFTILLERNLVGEERCAQEISRRLSPGIPADVGAGWFEGLAQRNRYVLLSRPFLWQQLDDYIQSLEQAPFHRSLVFLRRAFGTFEPREKAALAELLGDVWGSGADEAGEVLQKPLSEEEREKLDELNDFDFGDL
ncbi:DUF5682 family protein [Paenibacillus sp. y28]|uniref:DUF5682 family protein n=1 Tax=Paenibacillus sp. y28 TaxID=3129110 RepID=UPI0030182545